MPILKKIKILLLSFIIFASLIIVYLISANFVEPKAYDFMTRNVLTQKLPFHNKQVYGSEDIVLIVIDDKTTERYRWPWKRDLYCKLFEYFNKYTQPSVIVHDALISNIDTKNKQTDLKYFNTIKKIDNMTAGFMPQIKPWENEKFGYEYSETFNKYALNTIDLRKKAPLLYNSLSPAPKEYLNSIKHLGSIAIIPGFLNTSINSYTFDEIFRNSEYFLKYNDKIFPSLALNAFLLKNNNPKMIIKNSEIEFPDLNYKIKYYNTKYQSIIPIRFYKIGNYGYSHSQISAIHIMDSYDNIKKGKAPIVDPAFFKDKIVVIGVNVIAGEGLNDNKNSPLIAKHPGVDIQATAIDNIVHNDFLKIVPVSINILITILGMILIYAIIRINDLFKSITLSFLVISTYLLLATICYYFKIVTSVITPVIMFLTTMLYGYTHKFVLENKSKEKVKSAMGKYMSQDVMKRIVMHIDNLELGGKKATVTVLFADIRGFTSMSEKMTAQEVSEILNEYFTEMEPIITKYNGIINKFIGDAVMAIFGEPIQDKNHAQNAVKCGYEMLQKVKELQNKWAKEGKPKIEIGIGINTGEVFVGNIGSINRMEYTVIGDTVNLASRLESYNKVYKTKMLISSSTYENSKNLIDTIKISDVEIRGKAHKMNIYEVLKVNTLN